MGYSYKRKIVKKLSLILKNQETLMATIQELSAKVDTLQAAIDAEQAQIKAALDKLIAANEDLKKLIVDGGTEAERQAVSTKLDGAISDVQSTLPDEPGEEEPPVEEPV